MIMAKEQFSASKVSNEPLLTSADQAGSHNSNMVASIPEVPISWFSEIETKLYWLSYHLWVIILSVCVSVI